MGKILEMTPSVIKRDRFHEVMRFFHLSDNIRLDKAYKKFFKVRPLIDLLKERLLSYFQVTDNSDNLSIVESMVPLIKILLNNISRACQYALETRFAYIISYYFGVCYE